MPSVRLMAQAASTGDWFAGAIVSGIAGRGEMAEERKLRQLEFSGDVVAHRDHWPHTETVNAVGSVLIWLLLPLVVS